MPLVPGIGRRVLGEFVGTALLLAAVVGSGITADRLSDDDGVELLVNAFATAGALVALILCFGSVSGAHFNPAVTLADRFFGAIDNATAAAAIGAQALGGIAGVVIANLMFDLPAIDFSTTERSSPALWLAEVVATFGLVLVIFGVVRSGKAAMAPFAVGGYIAGAYFFTSSTSFANPAVTIARMFSDTYAGIEPASAPAFIAAQLVGAAAAVAVARILYPIPAVG